MRSGPMLACAVFLHLCLASVRPQVSLSAEEAVGDEETRQRVLKALQNEEEQERWAILWELAQAGKISRWAEQDVAKLLQEESWRGKRQSVWAYHVLMAMGGDGDAYLDALVKAAGWLHYNRVAVGEVGVVGGPRPKREGPPLPPELGRAWKEVWTTASRAIVRALDLQAEERRRTAAQCVKDMGAPPEIIVPMLAARAFDRALKPTQRAHAVELIASQRRYAGSVEPVFKAMTDEEPEVRAAAAAAHHDLSYPYDYYGSYYGEPRHPEPERAVAALIQALGDKVALVRANAARGLRGMGQQAGPALEALVAALGDKDEWVRQNAASALGQIRRAEAVPPLVEAVKTGNYEAVPALGTLAWRSRDDETSMAQMAKVAVPALIDSLAKKRGQGFHEVMALRAYRQYAKDAVPELLRALRDGRNAHDLCDVAFALADIGGDEARKASATLVTWVSGNDSQRGALAYAIGRLFERSPDTDALLCMVLGDVRDYIRARAAESAGMVGSTEVVQKKLALLAREDPDSSVREAAATALEQVRRRSKKNEDF